jgi:5-methylcytosine-specific restriction endonuclease McrA
MKPWAKSFYKSKAWRQCRDAFFASRYGLCERCGKPGVIVHHKIKLTPSNINDPTVTLNWNNLELLCQDCHNKEHGGSVTADGLEFDENGDLIYTPQG